MEPNRYTDPLEDALSQGAQRVAQLASLATAMRQVAIQRRAIHDALVAGHDDRTARALRQMRQALEERARLDYAPALDPKWLARADFLLTARAWGGAASYADTDSAAWKALRQCESRLRELHPYAMANYDRLKNEGLSPLDAMRQTIPLFTRPPHARPGEPGPIRPALDANGAPGVDQESLAGDAEAEPAAAETEEQTELRGQQIADRLQAEARATGRPPLGPDELIMVLEAITNLPEEIITKIAGRAEESYPRVTRTAAQVAAESFPVGAAEAVTASSTGKTQNPIQLVTLDLPAADAKASQRTP